MLKKEITVEKIMLYHMAMDINQWLHQKGEDIDKYYVFMDRVCDIQEVLRGAIEKAKDSLRKYDGETSSIKIIDFPKGIECQQNTNTST